MNEGGATVVVEQKRLRGSFSKPMELQQFPFDIQVITCLAVILSLSKSTFPSSVNCECAYSFNE